MVVPPRGSAALAATTASLLLLLLPLLLPLFCACCQAAVVPPQAASAASPLADKHRCWQWLCERGYFDGLGCNCRMFIPTGSSKVLSSQEVTLAAGIGTQTCGDEHWGFALANFWRESPSAGDGFRVCEATASAAILTQLSSHSTPTKQQQQRRTSSRRSARSLPMAAEASEAPREADGTSTGSKQERLKLYLDDVRKSLAAELSASNVAADVMTTVTADNSTPLSDFSSSDDASSGLTASGATDEGSAAVGGFAGTAPSTPLGDSQATTFSTSSTDGENSGSLRRRRDAPVGSGAPFTFGRASLKWRAISYWPGAAPSDQETVFGAALRQWAAATPLCFSMDRTSDVAKVDILFGFYRGLHGGDNHTFDGPGGELAHSFPGVFAHFDADESWYTGSTRQTGVALLPVVLHELGHLIGLPLSASSTAIMFEKYDKTAPEALLGDADRAAVLDKYGVCGGSLDAAIDVQYLTETLDDFGNVVLEPLYQTYFFRGGFSWLYSNRLSRPADYQPLNIASAWTGLPNALDAVVQYVSGGVYQLLFFKGSTVYVYSYSGHADGVIESHFIASFFPAGSLGEPIPNNIDSAYFDPRDGNVYFFKGSVVYVYHYNATGGAHSCCERKSNILDAFPLAAGEPAAAPASALSYQRNVDAVYRSVNNNTLFFFVGDHVWKNRGFNSSDTVTNNSMVYLGLWSSYWRYICDVTC